MIQGSWTNHLRIAVRREDAHQNKIVVLEDSWLAAALYALHYQSALSNLLGGYLY